jgi:NADH-quinone oxidoreductase subunit G
VRNDALRADVAARLSNAACVVEALAQAAPVGLERVADVPIHFADPIVRRAPALQKTRDAATPVARIAPQTLAALGIDSGSKVRLKQGGQLEVVVVSDAQLAPGCVRLAAAHASTAVLGAMSGEISLERV